jgi:hypothetical protein
MDMPTANYRAPFDFAQGEVKVAFIHYASTINPP